MSYRRSCKGLESQAPQKWRRDWYRTKRGSGELDSQEITGGLQLRGSKRRNTLLNHRKHPCIGDQGMVVAVSAEEKLAEELLETGYSKLYPVREYI
ncbi:hypothetical protein NDU88_005166 [Pleurodeles waltl]|uniref:Uncharacterized protein n=1 Tax=Pleurodeles waltl TaxID=8319 RepID=A0AAV7WX41_PLEWA|nr:hypothetical protein NDU88_005166 [Pleurodeles waltl]